MYVQGHVRVRWGLQGVGLATLFALTTACMTTNPASVECSMLIVRPTAVDVPQSDSSYAELAARAFGESLETALRQGGMRVGRDGARTAGSLILSTVITSSNVAKIGDERDNATFFELAGFFAVCDHRGAPIFVGRIPSAASAGTRIDDEWRKHVAHLSATCLAEELRERLQAPP